jgi:hypothetical protein
MIHVVDDAKGQGLCKVSTTEELAILNGVKTDLKKACARMLVAYSRFPGETKEFHVVSSIANTLLFVDGLLFSLHQRIEEEEGLASIGYESKNVDDLLDILFRGGESE